MHLMQKIIAASALALSLGLAFSTAATAQEAGHFQRQDRSTEFTRRLQMIDALEATHDDARLADLVKADSALDSYYIVLRRVCTHLKDAQLAEKMLNLPVLDKNSANYKQKVGNIYAEIAANAEETTPEIKALLFDRIKDDKAAKDDALRFIFKTAAMFTGDRTPNAEMTRQLVQNGADLDGAVTNVTKLVMSNSDPLLQGSPQERLARVEQLWNAVKAPAAKPPMHLKF